MKLVFFLNKSFPKRNNNIRKGNATNDFNYSLVDAKTKEFLEAFTASKARGYGCFEEWYRS